MSDMSTRLVLSTPSIMISASLLPRIDDTPRISIDVFVPRCRTSTPGRRLWIGSTKLDALGVHVGALEDIGVGCARGRLLGAGVTT